MNLPLLRQLSHLDEKQLLELGQQTSGELLEKLSKNKATEHIEASVQKWINNQLPLIDKYDIRAEDINLLLFIRKMAFVHFLHEYCKDSLQLVELIKEIDLYTMQVELRSTNTYIDILKESLQQSSHFIQKVNDTIPGAVYVFDLVDSKGIFSNKKIAEVAGYPYEEIHDYSFIIDNLVHNNDRDVISNKMQEVKSARDHEIISYKYRIRKKDGSYKWMRNFESVFKRNENGAAVETIGIMLDVDREHKAADALKENEGLYKRAEAITHIGSFVWELKGNKLKWSDELYRIYGIDPTKEEIDFEKAGKLNHPEDIPFIRNSYSKAINNKEAFDFYYRINSLDGRAKILHARGEMILNNQDTVQYVIGTVQDVTEKQMLIRKLEHSETIHKQAEALTNMGSWTWNLKTNETEWSEQMYRIYEIDEPVQVDVFRDFIHPVDREKAKEILEHLLKEKFSDHSFRIITKSGKIKKLHTIARVHSDVSGNPAYIVGAEQDITEKENLLETLRNKERIYKQAEELANMGNWNWDLITGKIEWTDHLYRIYGLEPGTEITIDTSLAFVHPDDREKVKNSRKEINSKDLLDFSFRIITPDKKTKIIRSIAQVSRDREGKPVQLIVSERDITEKQTLIDRLRQSESLYKQAQMLTHVGNWSWDITTNILEWSDELYRIYGLEPQSQKLNYEEQLAFIHAEDREQFKLFIEQAFATGQSWEFNHRIVRRNGEMRILYSTGEVFVNENGKPFLMIGTAQDITEKQKMIEKLQESDRFFRQAQSLARLGSWTVDLRTNEFNWSDEMYNIYELLPGEKFSYAEWMNYVFQDDQEEVISYYDECVRERKMYDKIHRIQLKNGKVKTVHRKAEFLLDGNGMPVKMMGTTQDITEEYRTQQELKENQTFIRKIADATPSIISSYNVNTGEYVFVSEGLEKLLGYSPEEVMEKGISFVEKIIHPDDLPLVMAKQEKALAEANEDPSKNDIVIEWSYRMLHKNGEYKWFHTYGTIFDRNRENQVEHVLNISLDITEQITASETIREQEHFIQQIADASPTILYLYDVNQQGIVYINREMFFVLGYAPEEIIALKDRITSELYHPEDFPLLPARKESSRNFQQVDSMIQYECRMKNKLGEWRWLLVREIVFKTDDAGNVTQILGAALDINKRKEMEKTILQNTMLLEQSNASLEEFAYVASHDLKEPLRKISTFGDRLVASQADHLTSDGQVYLKKIIDASQRMQTMINDLLSISMITGNTAFEKQSLQNILEETIQTLEFKIEQQKAIIKADPLPEAYIIPFQFRQLFQNLLSNSLKFVRPGIQPEIQIKYQLIPAAETAPFHLTKAAHYHKIIFSDNGIGFDNEYAGKIFAIFQRLHGRSEYEGSGIGLSICKKIVEHHGGVIYAEGQEGSGASFTIILPA